MNKAYVVGIILIIVCAGVIPCVDAQVVNTAATNESITVTSEACGGQDSKGASVQLTGEQYQNLQRFLNEFKTQLYQASSREDVTRLFRDAVVELNEYGVLPQGLNVQEAQRLVTGTPRHLGGWARLARSNTSNYLCLIAGNTNGTIVTGFPLCNLACALGSVGALVELRNWIPVQLASVVFMGGWGEFMGYAPGPAGGWVYSLGANGVRNWTGPMHGNYPGTIIRFRIKDVMGWYPGIIGFTGINIMGTNTEHFFLGTALAVSIVAV